MMMLLLLLVLLVVVAVTLVALRNAQDFSDANEVVPGVATGAPKAWAGSHTPEARLHRRLRDAMTALRSNTSLDDPSLASIRTALEEQAIAVDERLVAVASLPKTHRESPMQKITSAVEVIESVVADVVLMRGPGSDDMTAALDQVSTRVELVRQARAELDEYSFGSGTLGTTGSGELGVLRDGLADDGGPAGDTDAPGETDGTTGTP